MQSWCKGWAGLTFQCAVFGELTSNSFPFRCLYRLSLQYPGCYVVYFLRYLTSEAICFATTCQAFGIKSVLLLRPRRLLLYCSFSGSSSCCCSSSNCASSSSAGCCQEGATNSGHEQGPTSQSFAARQNLESCPAAHSRNNQAL